MSKKLPTWVISVTAIAIVAVCVSLIISKQAMALPSNMSKLSATEYANGVKRAADAAQRVSPRLSKEMRVKGIAVGNPVYIRIFKESRELELWVENTQTKKYVHFKTYKIAAMSGALGPKLKEGDYQAPEGFYFVNRTRMNPQSRFHLAFNVGYPNSYDRSHGRTGSALMVHGNRVSVGCFAMTDYYIEEIYTLCDAAMKQGQPYFRVHSFPFRMTTERMVQARKSQWYGFWKNLKQGHDAFDESKVPPNVQVSNKKYIFN